MKKFTFPDEVIIDASSLDGIEKKFPLTFLQYEGFSGTLSDSLLPKFTVLLENHATLVGLNVLSDTEIESLRTAKVTGIQFQKLSGLTDDSTKVQALILDRYPQCKIMPSEAANAMEKQAWDLIDIKTGNKVGKLAYVPLGIAGFIFELLPS